MLPFFRNTTIRFSVEKRIQELCLKLMATDDPQVLQQISRELQKAIHEHIEHLRRQLLDVPALRPDKQKPSSAA